MSDLIRQNAKAIAGFLAAGVMMLLRRVVEVDPNVEITLAALITAIIVWLVPNKPA